VSCRWAGGALVTRRDLERVNNLSSTLVMEVLTASGPSAMMAAPLLPTWRLGSTLDLRVESGGDLRVASGGKHRQATTTTEVLPPDPNGGGALR
jgi:hypothetical protein